MKNYELFDTKRQELIDTRRYELISKIISCEDNNKLAEAYSQTAMIKVRYKNGKFNCYDEYMTGIKWCESKNEIKTNLIQGIIFAFEKMNHIALENLKILDVIL